MQNVAETGTIPGMQDTSKNFEFKFLFLYAPIKPIGLERYKVSKISSLGLMCCILKHNLVIAVQKGSRKGPV